MPGTATFWNRCGRATAEAIPGSELVLMEGMGHDLAPGLRLQLAERIAEFVWRAEAAGRNPYYESTSTTG